MRNVAYADFIFKMQDLEQIMDMCHYTKKQLSHDVNIDAANLCRMFKGKHIPSIVIFLMIRRQILRYHYICHSKGLCGPISDILQEM